MRPHTVNGSTSGPEYQVRHCCFFCQIHQSEFSFSWCEESQALDQFDDRRLSRSVCRRRSDPGNAVLRSQRVDLDPKGDRLRRTLGGLVSYNATNAGEIVKAACFSRFWHQVCER